jgi:hypothetical protein
MRLWWCYNLGWATGSQLGQEPNKTPLGLFIQDHKTLSKWIDHQFRAIKVQYILGVYMGGLKQ